METYFNKQLGIYQMESNINFYKFIFYKPFTENKQHLHLYKMNQYDIYIQGHTLLNKA